MQLNAVQQHGQEFLKWEEWGEGGKDKAGQGAEEVEVFDLIMIFRLTCNHVIQCTCRMILCKSL